MGRFSNERFVIGVLACLFVAATALVAVALGTRTGRMPLLPPEPPELTAKRADPENAFFALQKLAETLPTASPPLPVIADLDRLPVIADLDRKPGPIGQLIGTTLPDDAPEVIAYLETCRPKIEELREIIRRDIFLLPKIEDAEHWEQMRRLNSNVLAPGSLMQATGIHLENQRDYRGATKMYLDMVLFGQRVRADGLWSGTEIERSGLLRLRLMAWQTEDADLLGRTIADLAKLGAGEPPVLPTIKYTVRTRFDAPRSARNRRRGGLEPAVREVRTAFELRRARRELRKVLPSILENIDKSYLDAKRAFQDHDDLSRYSVATIRSAEHALNDATALRADIRATQAVLAIRWYKIANETLPDSLDALVPDYLPEVPIDPFTEQPLLYKLEDGDYRLYSVSEDGRDGGGIFDASDTGRYRHLHKHLSPDLIFHRPEGIEPTG